MLTEFRARLRRASRRGPWFRARTAEPRPRLHSVSSCSEYRRCPRRYRYGYVDRLPQDRPVPASWRHGTVVHRALETGLRLGESGVPLADTVPDALAEFEIAWHAEGLPDDENWRDDSRELVRRALTDGRLEGREILGVEQPFRADVDGGLRFGGYADLVLRRDDETIEVVDHKVTRSARNVEELAADPQLNLYGWFARRQWPWARRVLATHHYPPLDRTVTVELTDASMDANLDALVATAVQAEADREFAPSPGPECESCPWFDRCPAQNKSAVSR